MWRWHVSVKCHNYNEIHEWIWELPCFTQTWDWAEREDRSQELGSRLNSPAYTYLPTFWWSHPFPYGGVWSQRECGFWLARMACTDLWIHWVQTRELNRTHTLSLSILRLDTPTPTVHVEGADTWRNKARAMVSSFIRRKGKWISQSDSWGQGQP